MLYKDKCLISFCFKLSKMVEKQNRATKIDTWSQQMKPSLPAGTRYVSVISFTCSFPQLLTDVDECTANIHDCEQICVNTWGSFECQCDTGFKLDDNKKTCSSKFMELRTENFWKVFGNYSLHSGSVFLSFISVCLFWPRLLSYLPSNFIFTVSISSLNSKVNGSSSTHLNL